MSQLICLRKTETEDGDLYMAQPWPVVWKIYTKGGVPVGDSIDESPRNTDIVGDVTYPAAYYQYDGTAFFFRMRLNANPQSGSTLTNFNWGVLFDTNSDPSTYEWLITVNGQGSQIELWQNHIFSPVDSFADQAEGQTATAPYIANYVEPIVLDTNVRVIPVSDGSNFEGTLDYFLDWQISWTTLSAFLGITESTALRFVFYTATSNRNANKDVFGGSPTSLSDGFGDPVSAANTAPTVPDYNVSTLEDTPVSGTVVGFDMDGDPLFYSLFSTPLHGTATVNPDGTWMYVPNFGYSGMDIFTVLVDDVKGGTAVSTITVSIIPVNDKPTVPNYTVTTPFETTIGGKVEGNDVDGDALTYTISTAPSNGAIILQLDGTWSYTPDEGFFGRDYFTVLVDDGYGGTALSYITVKVLPPPSFKQLSVSESFTLPEAKPDIEEILDVSAEVVIKGTREIDTPIAVSHEGQKLTGVKLVIEGGVVQKIGYIADLPSQPVHSVHFNMPFSTYIVLPKGYVKGTPFKIVWNIEDIYTNLIDKRTIFKNVTLLLEANIIV